MNAPRLLGRGMISGLVAVLCMGPAALVATPAVADDPGKMPMKLRFEPQYSIVQPDDFGTV